MTLTGGSAAINGFLYQILHHLDWVADIQLTGRMAGQKIQAPRLVLEPRTGGDAQAEASGLYLVEQYKTRTNRTWSLTDVIDILRDLRKAVPRTFPPSAWYRFVTDGRPGRLDEFVRFTTDLRSMAHPNDLDGDRKRSFNRLLRLSDQEFFAHIVEKTRSAGSETPADESRSVFHLLGHFEMKFRVSGHKLSEAVERKLRPYADDLGNEHGIRERLIGYLIGRLGKGETHLDNAALKTMLQGVGLSPDRLRRAARLGKAIARSARPFLDRLKYRPDQDVREIPRWPEEKPVLLISADSGTGKSWQLAKLLEAYTETDRIAVFVNPAADTEVILTRAAHQIWQVGLGNTSEKSLYAVSTILRQDVFGLQTPLFTVAVDDIQDIDLARDLIRHDWTELRARLVLTVPTTVARALEQTDSNVIHVHDVHDFSVEELDALLQKCGQRWADLPSDLKRLLRKPILAGLFLELSHTSFQHAPRNEYEIFEKYWGRISANGRPGDEGIVIGLAAKTLKGDPYPIPRENWQEIGLTEENCGRLEAAGWLHSTEHGEAEFVHDRLLNWAVAKRLARQFSRGDVTIEGLYDFLTGANEGIDRKLFQRLAYVPMDTLWLLAADESNFDLLSELVAKMENLSEYGTYGRHLYRHQLPMLGQRCVPILIQRLNVIVTDSTDDLRVNLIRQAFTNLARQEHVDLRSAIDTLLSSQCWERQSVAVATLEVSPSPGRLDRLWEIHKQSCAGIENDTNRRRGAHFRYEATFSALKAGVERYPEWLRTRIQASSSVQEPVSELAYLLSGMHCPAATAIWRDMDGVLMKHISPDKPRSLLRCIQRFSDSEKIEFVLRHLTNPEDFASGVALETLAVLDPELAIDQLVNLDSTQKFFANQWLPVLLRARPRLTGQRIRELAESEHDGRHLIEHCFRKRQVDLDVATLRFVLQSLANELREYLKDDTAEDRVWLFRSLEFLGSIFHPSHLRIFQAEAGGELERMIVIAACDRLATVDHNHDPMLENAHRVLVLMAGEGMVTLINQELDSENYWVRRRGLKWAFFSCNSGTIERLAAIARRPLPCDNNGKREPRPYQEFYAAMTALAAWGVDEVLVEILAQTSAAPPPRDLPRLRAHRGPMPKTLTNTATNILRSTAPPEDSLMASVLVTWLSGDADLIPAIHGILDRTDPESLLARYICLALRALCNESEDFARFAGLVARTKANVKFGLDALIGLGDTGLTFLRDWANDQYTKRFVAEKTIVVRFLHNHAETRKLAVDIAVNLCQSDSLMLDPLYDIAAESGESSLREEILDKAFAEQSAIVTAPLRAIQGLAKFDAARAADAIGLGLHRYARIEQELCQLIIGIAPNTAAERLIRVATSDDRKSLNHAVGRSLRRLDPNIVTPIIVERMSGSVPARKLATELAGWLPSPKIAKALGHLADQDKSTEIRHAALAALYRHREETAIQALLEEFPAADHSHRWALLFTILEVADPYLLTNRHDPLWLGQILKENIPYAFTHYAKTIIKERRQKIKRQMK